MAKRTTLTENDLKVIKAILQDEHTRLVEHLAPPAELCAVIIPLFKIEALLEKAGK